MKIVSWNVNGIRACLKKGFREFVENEQPDILCLQETKATPEQVDLTWVDELGYSQAWSSAEKKGYSGTTTWTRLPVLETSLGLGIAEHDNEGRIVTTEFQDFSLVNVYTPNAKRGLTRLDYRMQWDSVFLQFVCDLNQHKPVIFCGDLNCAHKEIDLANPKANRKNAGFTDQERGALDAIASAGFVDVFREFNQSPGQYSWWTSRVNARERNVGWRLDYFWVGNSILKRVTDACIRSDVYGSDHCPIEITLR